jgi:4-amino-4-deoxy-L-arabinose transferase-like glycosyltransferase
MDITVPVLLFTCALIGAAAGLRYKVFVLVPIALLIALVSATVLHKNGFEPGGGIVVIIGCLVLGQAAYIVVQIFTQRAHLISDDETDSVPGRGR